MEFLEWSDEYKCGIRVLDYDHENLFNIVNSFHESVGKEEPEYIIERTFASLTKYAEEHFKREEAYLEGSGYPDLERHRQEHRKLLADLDKNKRQYKTAPPNFDFLGFLDFLQDWIVRHILEEDMKFVPYLRGEKSKSS